MTISTLVEFEAAVATLTPYQKRVLSVIEKWPNQMANTWEVCESGFNSQWKANRASHGAMFRSVLQAAQRMEELGVITILSPRDRFDTYTYCSRRKWMK